MLRALIVPKRPVEIVEDFASARNTRATGEGNLTHALGAVDQHTVLRGAQVRVRAGDNHDAEMRLMLRWDIGLGPQREILHAERRLVVMVGQ